MGPLLRWLMGGVALATVACGGAPPANSPTSPPGSSGPAPAASSAPSVPGAPRTQGCGFDPGKQGDGDFEIAPPYKAAPELTVKAGTPRGAIVNFEMKSTASKIFPGINGPFTRGVAVYVPKQYVDGTAAPFMVVQDGSSYVDIRTPILDTMIAARRLPAMIVVFVDNGGGDARGSERGLEYDRVSADYVTFIETEVLPLVPKNPEIQQAYKNLRLTKDPEGRATMGTSSGGAAAFTMAWFRPDLYRRVLTYSGTFVNQHPEKAYPGSAWEYHTHLVPDAPPKPLRVFLQVGQNDLDWNAEFRDGKHSWKDANRAMAKVLAQKGYHYRFVYAKDAEHVDEKVMKQTLPDALAWLWRGYAACPDPS